MIKIEITGMKNENEILQRYNLHTHTYRCKHAEGDASEYAAEAEKAGVEMFGFSEHPPINPEGVWTPFIMDEGDLEGYFSAVKTAKEEFPGMEILTGFEMNLYSTFKTYFEDTFLHREEIDFLIGGVHWIKFQGEWMWIQKAETAGHLREYVNEIIALMESGLMSFITHPDSFASGYLSWDTNAEACSRDILSAAEEYRIPLELNGFGIRRPDIDTPDGPRKRYPLLKFWELAAEYDISVVCSSDAHKPEDAVGGLEGCHKIIRQFDLKHHPIQEQLTALSSKGKVLNQ